MEIEQLPTQYSNDLQSTQRTSEISERHDDRWVFLNKTYSPESALKFVQRPLDIIKGTQAPTLQQLSEMFDENPHIEWLYLHIIALSEYSGARYKATPYQARRLAYKIFDAYPFLRVTELMLFFDRLASGRYGKVDWGSFDPINIFSKLPQFMQDRQDLFYEAEEEERNRQFEENKRNASPCPPHIKKRLDEHFKRVAEKSHRPETKQAVDGLLKAFAQQSNPLTPITDEEIEKEKQDI